MVNRIIPFRDRLRQRRKLIVFICTGNTCRSPMAAAYFRKLLTDHNIKNIEIRSAGVMTINGLLASTEAIQVMEADEINLRKHRSTPLTPELVRKADLILAMSPFHRQTAIRLCEEAKNKTHLLKEFSASDLKNVQITDPMGCTLEVFKKVYKEIKTACEMLVEHEFVSGVLKPVESVKPAQKKAAKKKSAKKGEGDKGGKTKAKAPAGKSAPAKAAKKAAPSKGKAKAVAKKAPAAKGATAKPRQAVKARPVKKVVAAAPRKAPAAAVKAAKGE